MKNSLKLPSIFSDGMVLQRDTTVPVWGWAYEGDMVKVSFAGQVKKARAGEDGKWTLKLSPLTATFSPAEMIISSSTSHIVIKNILVGEVWLATGQSNMEIKFSLLLENERDKKLQPLKGYMARVMETSSDPLIRQIRIDELTAPHGPQQNVACKWHENHPDNNANFGVTPYFFARKLRRELVVPVGIVLSSVGGTLIEPWLPKEAFMEDEDLKNYYHTRLTAMQDDPEGRKEYEKYLNAIEKWEAENTDREKPKVYHFPNLPNRQPATLYNAMIAPLIPYAIKGAIWYQGESNRHHNPERYGRHMKAMVKTWRKKWGQGDFPFYYAQLANFDTQFGRDGWVIVCEQQALAIDMNNSGMIVLNDIGETKDIHPINKIDVANRFALWALAKDYGVDIPSCCGPLYESSRINGDKIIVSFSQCDSGLMVGQKNLTDPVAPSEAPLGGFEIAGKDQNWHSAKANIIDKNSIEVFCSDVPEPISVRYAWQPNPDNANLYNKHGLPTSLFRTQVFQ